MSDATCKTCKWFAKGKGGDGYRAMVQMMIASGNRYHPSSADIGVIRVTDKDGQCTFSPEGVAKWEGDACGQHRVATS